MSTNSHHASGSYKHRSSSLTNRLAKSNDYNFNKYNNNNNNSNNNNNNKASYKSNQRCRSPLSSSNSHYTRLSNDSKSKYRDGRAMAADATSSYDDRDGYKLSSSRDERNCKESPVTKRTSNGANVSTCYKEVNKRKSKSLTRKIDDPPYSRCFILCSKGTSEFELNQVFQKYGRIQDIWIVRDYNTKMEKGIVYIKYSKASEAARAVEEMNGKYLNDRQKRPVKVFISGCKSQINRSKPNCELYDRMHRLFVTVDKDFTKFDLKNAFKKYGTIKSSHIIFDQNTKESKGIGYITFSKASEAAKALEECNKSFKAKFARLNSQSYVKDEEDMKEKNKMKSASSSSLSTSFLKNNSVNDNDNNESLDDTAESYILDEDQQTDMNISDQNVLDDNYENNESVEIENEDEIDRNDQHRINEDDNQIDDDDKLINEMEENISDCRLDSRGMPLENVCIQIDNTKGVEGNSILIANNSSVGQNSSLLNASSLNEMTVSSNMILNESVLSTSHDRKILIIEDKNNSGKQIKIKLNKSKHHASVNMHDDSESTSYQNRLTSRVCHHLVEKNPKQINSPILLVKSKLNEIYLRQLFDLVPGLIEFGIYLSDCFQISNQYLVRYENEILSAYVVKKFNELILPTGESITVEYLNEDFLRSFFLLNKQNAAGLTPANLNNVNLIGEAMTSSLNNYNNSNNNVEVSSQHQNSQQPVLFLTSMFNQDQVNEINTPSGANVNFINFNSTSSSSNLSTGNELNAKASFEYINFNSNNDGNNNNNNNESQTSLTNINFHKSV